MKATLFGALLLGLPLLLLGLYFLWRRWRTIFWMYVGAILLGLGYLATTGALSDIGSIGEGVVYEAADAPADTDTDGASTPTPDAEPSAETPAAPEPLAP